MKRIAAMILTAGMIFTMTACGNSSAEAPAETPAQEEVKAEETQAEETMAEAVEQEKPQAEAENEAEAEPEEPEEEKPKKETTTYTIPAYDDTAEVAFDFVKDDKYTVKEGWGSQNMTLFKDESNLSTMKVTLVHDRMAGPNITKEEDDFYDEDFHDYSKVEKGGFSGWEVYEKDYGYRIELAISDADDEGKGYAILFEVQKALAGMKDDMHFEVEEFVSSDDFQDIFDTIKLTVK